MASTKKRIKESVNDRGQKESSIFSTIFAEQVISTNVSSSYYLLAVVSINLYLLGLPLLSSAPKGLKLYLMNLSKASSVGRCKNWNQKFVRVGNSLLYKPINEAYVTFFLYTEARGEIKVSSPHRIVIAPMG